jgi:hypothetical protein
MLEAPVRTTGAVSVTPTRRPADPPTRFPWRPHHDHDHDHDHDRDHADEHEHE